MTKTDTTPIVMLTLQDLRDVIREEMGSSVNVTHESEMPSASQHIPAKLVGKEVVFGLAGICKIFNCKMSRAQKLKNTIIKDTGKATKLAIELHFILSTNVRRVCKIGLPGCRKAEGIEYVQLGFAVKVKGLEYQ